MGSSFADKAKDLNALRTAVDDAASASMGLWFSYLFVLFYLTIATGSVTHRDLFFANPVKLPFLNVELPLVAFFIVAPMLFLVVHGFILLQLSLLARKVRVFDGQLRRQITDPLVQDRLRRQLPSVIFVQLLAGPHSVRTGVLGLMLRMVAFISLVVGPIALLVLFELQFLPFHSLKITWWHRFAVILDIILLWLLWPSISTRKKAGIVWRDLRDWRIMGAAAASITILLFVVTLATFPGEVLEENLPQSWISLHKALIEGASEVDPITRRPTSLWPNSNRIVLPGIDVIDHAKLDSDEKLARVSETLSLRGRQLEGAILYNANLTKVDLTGAQLNKANLKDARLQGALLDEAKLHGAILNFSKLQGASLQKAALNGAQLREANLHGANLFEADLSKADLEQALLFAAELSRAVLHETNFNFAKLGGANLSSVTGEGVRFSFAELQGVSLTSAKLHCALLDGTQLQGAVMAYTSLDKVTFGPSKPTVIWKVDVRSPTGADIREAVDCLAV